MRWEVVAVVLALSGCADAVESHLADETSAAERRVVPMDGVERRPAAFRPSAIDPAAPWAMHTIVSGLGPPFLDGADGVDLADFDGDGLLDVVSNYESSHAVTLSLNPGLEKVRSVSSWPTVRIPPSGNGILGPEDAVAADVDGDGWLDILVGAEGDQRVGVYFSPNSSSQLLSGSAWTRMDLTSSMEPGNQQRCMRVALADLDNDGVKDIVCGGKESSGGAAQVRYYTSATPRVASSWLRHDIVPAGWIMQLVVLDVDGDGDQDIVYSDRAPTFTPSHDLSRMGVRWLENGGGTPPTWTEHQISLVKPYNRWFSAADFDRDGDVDIAVCRGQEGLDTAELFYNDGTWLSWADLQITPMPSNTGPCQDAAIADMDQDGIDDLVFTHFNPTPGGESPHDTLTGVTWLRNGGSELAPIWQPGDISGPDLGVKYDSAYLHDMDGDGDLDVVTSEQYEDTDDNSTLGPGLGVIWYENPTT